MPDLPRDQDPMAPKAMWDGVEVARITISRIVLDTEIVDQVTAVDNAGDPLLLADAVSMLGLAEHYLVAERVID